MVKGFNLPVEYVLYEMSYANIIMYNAIIPSYHSDDKVKNNRVIDADKNPEEARKILFGE
jgi:hypothetical protein